MKDKVRFPGFDRKRLFLFLEKNKKRRMINFLNQHDLFHFSRIKKFREVLKSEKSINMIDGSTLSRYLSIKFLRFVPRYRGPSFTKDYLTSPCSNKERHFFVGFEKKDIGEIKKHLSHLEKIEGYNPPYVKGNEFDEKEINLISKKINKFRTDVVWVGIASPKQNILSDELMKKTKAQYFMNTGAALDFLIGKKKEAPQLVRTLGVEWLYRLVTDFKYTRKKVWRSFVALKYLKFATLER